MTKQQKCTVTTDNKLQKSVITAGASISALPMHYPLFERSLFARSQILSSKFPGDLSHTGFFTKRTNYFRGMSMNLMFIQPLYPAVEGLLGFLLEKIQRINDRNPNLAEKLVAGFIAGGSTAVVENPYEVVNIKAQKMQQSPAKAFINVLSESGVKGFCRGFMPMFFRNGVFASGLFVTTPELSKKLDELTPGTGVIHRLSTIALSAVLPATIFTSVVVPLDLAAVMRQSDPSQTEYTSAFEAMKKAYAKHGIRALKAGTLLRLLSCYTEMIGFNVFKEAYEYVFTSQKEPNSNRKSL